MKDINTQVGRCFQLALEINQTKKFVLWFDYSGHVNKLHVHGFFGQYKSSDYATGGPKNDINFTLYLDAETKEQKFMIDEKLEQLESQLLSIRDHCRVIIADENALADAAFSPQVQADVERSRATYQEEM